MMVAVACGDFFMANDGEVGRGTHSYGREKI